MKKFRAPQAVRDATNEDQGSLAKKVSKGEPLTFGDLQKITRSRGLCGEDGRRWARRILKREGVITAGDGPYEVPTALDTYLGPTMFYAEVEMDVEKAADELAENEVVGICVPTEKGCLVMLPSSDELYATDDYVFSGEEVLEKCAQKDQSIPLGKYAEATLIDDTRSRASSFMKDAEGTSPVEISLVDDLIIKVGDIEMSPVYEVKGLDRNSSYTEVLKVDDSLGLVFGWAIVCKMDGEEYFDKQGDHIPEGSMLESATEFMIDKRTGGDMHRQNSDGEPVSVGKIVFSWPMTEEIAKAFGIETRTTGLMIAFKPDNDEILQKFREGEYTGFSIGGKRDPAFDEEVE